MDNTITFLVHGKPAASGSSNRSSDILKHLHTGKLKQSVQVGTLRGMDSDVTVSAEPGKDVVVVHIANGPSLVLHPDNARDLFKAQEGTLAAARGAGSATYLRIPSTLGWARPAPTIQKRGLFDKVTIAGIDILTGVSIDSAADATAGLVVGKVDAQVDPGIYQLHADKLLPLKGSPDKLPAIPAPGANQPLLVLVHGTFSNTQGTFGKLWDEHPDLVKTLFQRYGNRVYGLDHPTLGASPIGNALLLAERLPQGARVHLLTHSRGGLVAEVLARACSIDTLTKNDLAFFAGADYQSDLKDITKLVDLVRQRAIRVERIVRVACPARGTLLASNRLDAYISVLKWALELAQIPVLPSLVEFLGDVAQNKSDPDKIPGLAAQMPDSPLVRWLHAAERPIAGELRVVAGDVEGDSIGSWIKTLLTDAYFWTDNDFVVQTSSMYGGAPRAADASFVLDRGGKVSHFTYFSNPATARAVVNALTQDVPAGFRVIGPLSAAGKDASGFRGTTKPAPARPAVFVLPGILGSNLSVKGERVWLGWRMINGLDSLAYADPDQGLIKPDGPVDHVYAELCKFLSATHDVIEFAFDWRKPIEQEAKRLARDVDAALALRDATGQPVRLLAHSMGGLLARVMQLESPAVWEKMTARAGARVLMLGTPNGGSWAPMQVLSGDDSFGNALVAFGMPFQDGKARALMASFPGFLQLQAGLLDPERGLDQESTWKELAARDMELVKGASVWHNLNLQIKSFAWGVPPQSVLDMAVKLRKRLDVQRDEGSITAGKDKLVMVLGHAKFTPDGYRCVDEKGLVYLDALDQGDGRVTLGSAMLTGVPAWKIDAEHGNLPAVEEAFAGYLDLLQTGTTSRFEKLDPVSVKEKQKDRSSYLPNRGSRRAPSCTPDTLDRFSSDDGRTLSDVIQPTALALTVVNGSLKFVRHPVLMGHYLSSQLTGAEQVMDKLIGGSMGHSIAMGLYPDVVRTHQIFLNLGENEQNPLQLPRPESVIVVGLGPEGELSADALAATVCNGVIGWAQRLGEKHLAEQDSFELAATLIGSGGAGISAAQSARSIAEGVSHANRHLLNSKWPRVSHLHLTELYLDRATDAWRALRLLSDSAPGRYQVSDRIADGTGAQRRALDTGYRGAAYDMMSALSPDDSSEAVITYTLDTKRAREDVRAQRMQGPLIRMLLETASRGASNDRLLGRTLFKLLVPPEVEPFMAGSADMQISLNSGTSGIPWEMLDAPAADCKQSDNTPPWAIRVKLLRRLRTIEPSSQVTDAGINNDILVIGEPQCDPNLYPRLPGAWREAGAVAATLRQARLDGDVKVLISEVESDVGFDSSSIIKTLVASDWRIIHIAGHGAPACETSAGGVVLSNETFFGPDEIAIMRVAPSLVFVNCCHLAAKDPRSTLRPEPSPYERGRQAANVAEQLIKKGVRCVIAAGWAVDDIAAQAFATTFYENLVAGARFIDAVAAARMAAWQQDRNGTTWAAYQCYGDPDWRLERSSDPAEVPPLPLGEEFAGICSAPALALALESVITNARYKDEDLRDCETKTRYLEDRFADAWGNVGVVAEAFGLAWAEARKLQKSIEWNARAVAANDGTASIRAVEQLGNVRVLAAWENVASVLENKTALDDKQLPVARRKAADLARTEVKDALEVLVHLNKIQTSLERESLCASAFKRLAMIEHIAGSERDSIDAVNKMGCHYRTAEALGRKGTDSTWFYPALNGVAAEVIAGVRSGNRKPFACADTDDLERCIESRIQHDPDFQAVVGRAELGFYRALAAQSLDQELGWILEQYDDLYLRAKAPRYWNSVRDQLDFVLLLCHDWLVPAEALACEQLMQRLLEIAPRARISRPYSKPRKPSPGRQPATNAPVDVPT